MPRDDVHLLDIIKAARLIIEFKGPAEKKEFLQDAKTQSAVLHQLLIIGEAVKRISPEFRTAHPEVPWKDQALGPGCGLKNGARSERVQRNRVCPPGGRCYEGTVSRLSFG